MFNPALEYRKYIQKPRTATEKDQKLIKLALRFKELTKSVRPYQEIIYEIARDFKAGNDLLDPEIFEREDIEAFAKENKISNDPMVLQFIERAKPHAEWITQ